MIEAELHDLKFPIGSYKAPDNYTPETIANWINELTSFPNKLNSLCSTLQVEQLNWQYRPDGWTLKQVVHHLADSHMNAITRFKLSLTEEAPNIKPYLENRWAQLADYDDDNIQPSLDILSGVHYRWGILLEGMNDSDYKKHFKHPEHDIDFPLDFTLGMYVWHGNHHYAHIMQGIEREGK